jgi:hypothetical protein
MDHTLDRYRLMAGRWFSRGIPALSKKPRWRLPSFGRGKRKLIAGGLLLVSSACAAIWAEKISRSTALDEFEHSRTPSSKVWDFSLQSRGYRKLKDAWLIQKAIRRLPATLDTPGSVWSSRDSDWIAVFVNPEQSIPEAVFCFQCEAPPSDWKPMGMGWPAFDRTLAESEAYVAAVKARVKPKKPVEFRDSREVRY